MTEATDETPIRQAPRRRLPDFGGRSERRVSASLVAPAQLVMLIMVAFPAGLAIYIGLTEWTPTTGSDVWGAYHYWHWFDGYWEALTTPTFWAAVWRTVWFTGVSVTAEFAIGFGLALLFLKEFRGRGVVTLFFLLPMMVVPAVSGFIFFMLFQVDGPINLALAAVVRHPVSIHWLDNPSLVMWSTITVDIWQWTPLMFLILLSGLVSLPEDQMNAARVLGANFWQQFRYLILPMMKPILLIAVIIRTVEVFKVFDAPYLLTGGGPGDASTTISIYLYRQVFVASRWGYASAAAIVVLILVSVAAYYMVRPIEAAQDESTAALIGVEAVIPGTFDEDALEAEASLR